MVKSQLRSTSIDNWQAILEWQKQHDDMPATLPSTIAEADAGLKAACDELKIVRQEAEKHRQEHLEAKAALYEALEQYDKVKILRRIQRAEDLHRCYRKLQYIRKENEGSGLRELQVPRDPSIPPKQCPKDPQYWRTVRIPTEIKNLLIARNRQHFGQAAGTPLTEPAFAAAVKYDGTGLTADLILEGSYEAEDMDTASQLFIKHMASKTALELPAHITKDDFINKLKIWPEKTTTSPSGVHLAHYHALWKKSSIHQSGNSEAITNFETKREALIRAHLAILNYALRFGYSLHRWQKVVNVMLKKDATTSHIHRLRVIHLYEADYNLLLGVKWREAMYHAEDNKLLNEGLYGSRPGRSAHEPVLLETLQYEIYRSSMKSGIHKDLDATSCYDRILPWVASLCSRRIGINKKVAAVNGRTLELARYHLKTDLDISTEYYQHSPEYPIYGTGQGSGNSPYIWCFVASTLFDAFAEKAHGAYFYSYDGKK
jgi:hypothetical protein